MAIATLTYQLPEDEPEFRMARQGSALAAAVWEFDQLLRDKAKYGDDHILASEARGWLAEALRDRDVSLEP